MRSNFEKWEANVAARLISMSLCDWGLQKSQLRRQRANAKASKSVAPKARSKGGSASPKTMSKVCAEGALYWQRVEDNAFHLHQFQHGRCCDSDFDSSSARRAAVKNRFRGNFIGCEL